ncbi:hypothetical protein LWI28_005499 [Acer negundo]|uniref:Uncharacterized protein n=1 Tax=Acer negundo TaxID=4023 RepID=A0AAD5IPU4_ACENE|nr:hypothetical protein LWI28_005499 [Acer negundo]
MPTSNRLNQQLLKPFLNKQLLSDGVFSGLKSSQCLLKKVKTEEIASSTLKQFGLGLITDFGFRLYE